MRSLFARLRGHFQENVARYAVLALSILTPASGLLGTAAANLGGADTQGGRIALGAASALATAIAGVTFIRNLGIWQMLDKFGIAPKAAPSRRPSPRPPGKPSSDVGSTPVAATPPLPVADADSQSLLEPTDGLPSEDEGAAASEVEASVPAPTPPPEPPPSGSLGTPGAMGDSSAVPFDATPPAPGPAVQAQDTPAGDL